MSYAVIRSLTLALAATPLLTACGAGTADDPAPVDPPQCSGNTCSNQGAPTPTDTNSAQLCPPTDQINTSFLGGAGSGEVIRLTIDAPAMTYKLTWLASPMPVALGTVNPTRAGTSISGALQHPPKGYLPTDEQTRCAFILTPGQGTTADGQPYNTAAFFNAANPPMILVGMGGVAGGGTPGAELSFAGENLNTDLGLPAGTELYPSHILPVPDRKFDFFPFIGFAQTSSTLADMKGKYNSLIYHIHPTANYAALATEYQETFDDNGDCVPTNPGAVPPGMSAAPADVIGIASCATTPVQMGLDDAPLAANRTWTASADGDYFDGPLVSEIFGNIGTTYFGAAPQLEGADSLDLGLGASLPMQPMAIAHLIIGKVNGATVPVIVRTGVAQPSLASSSPPAADDESGIAVLAAANAVTPGALDGGFVGADSNIKYTATLIKGQQGSFIDPSTQATLGTFALDFSDQSNPGLVKLTDAHGNAGFAVTIGGLVVFGINGVENGGITPSSASMTTWDGVTSTANSAPYFGVGAQISK